MKTVQFTIERNRWYGWQMMPGYGQPYFSPIYVYVVDPLKKGTSDMTLRFFNAFYAEGVQEFKQTLRILLRGETFLFAESDREERRGAVVSELTMAWLRQHCPSLFTVDPSLENQMDPQAVLASVYGMPPPTTF